MSRVRRIKRTEPETVRQKRIGDAMEQLVTNSDFEAFIETMDDLKEEAFQRAINDTYVTDERLTAKILGEAHAYSTIISIYEGYCERLSQRISEQNEAVES